MGVWFSYVGVNLTEIMEARLPVLVETCRLASERIDRATATRMQASVDEIVANGETLVRQLDAIEVMIADVADNPALSLVREGVAELGISRLRTGRSFLEPEFTPADAAGHLAGYRQLVDAVTARDGDRAAAIVTERTDFVLSRLREGPARRPNRRVNATRTGRLAEHVAGVLQDDIERSGWPVGEVIGSETDLIERLGVSRTILREAVRILEHDGAVRTKRGPKGGLIVTAPDRAALVRSARIVLEYEGVTVAQLLDARGVLDVAAADLAATRCTPDDIATLRGVLESEQRRGDAAVSFTSLHDAVATTTGNRVLVLFVDLIGALVRAHVKADGQSPDGIAELSVEVHRAHERIVEAIIAGDPERAERRMARHVQASGAVLH
jgi:DNA-binding FadR family transcriptional regulator